MRRRHACHHSIVFRAAADAHQRSHEHRTLRLTLPCFRTDGVAGYARRNDAVIPSLDNTNFTLFALFKGDTDFGSAAALTISNSSTANDRAQIGQFSTTSQAFGRARGNSGVMASGFSGGTAFDGSWHSVAFRRNATAFELFVDGTRVASTTATLATGSTCNRTSLMHMREITLK